MDHPGQNLEQELVRSAAALHDLRGDELAPGCLHGVKFVQWHPLLLGEADRRSGRRAGIVVGHGLWRTGDFDLDVGLFDNEAAHPGGEPARAAEDLDGHALGQVFGDEVLIEDGFEFHDSAGQHPGGNLFGANFEKQFHAPVGRG